MSSPGETRKNFKFPKIVTPTDLFLENKHVNKTPKIRDLGITI